MNQENPYLCLYQDLVYTLLFNLVNVLITNLVNVLITNLVNVLLTDLDVNLVTIVPLGRALNNTTQHTVYLLHSCLFTCLLLFTLMFVCCCCLLDHTVRECRSHLMNLMLRATFHPRTHSVVPVPNPFHLNSHHINSLLKKKYANI